LDDLEDTVRNRLSVYHHQTKPLVKFYTELEDLQDQSLKFLTVNGLGLLSDVQARLVAAME
jgi:adenylate kinase